MKKGMISRTKVGYWQLWVKTDGVTTHLKAVAKDTDKAGKVMADCVKDYGLDQVGVKASDVGSATAMLCLSQGYGNILWMKPGWQG